MFHAGQPHLASMTTAHVQCLRALMVLANMQQGATSNSHLMVAAWHFQAAIVPSAEAALPYTSSLQTSGGALPDGLLSTALVPIHSSLALLPEPLFAVFTSSREAAQVLPQGSSCGSVRAMWPATAQHEGYISYRQMQIPITAGILVLGMRISQVDGTPLPKMSLLARPVVNAAEGSKAVQVANSRASVPAVGVRAGAAVAAMFGYHSTIQGRLQS